MLEIVQKYAKFFAAILTVVVTAGIGLVPVDYINWIQLGVAVLGAISVYAVPNKIAADMPKHADDDSLSPSA